jgi:dTMP kinase
MTEPDFYGSGFPYHEVGELPGTLVVLEGTDGVGRTTQINLLRAWLEREGFATSDTGLRRSPLTQPGLDQAKLGNTLGPLTMSLFYATDFADRLENQIIPALKAGFVVLSDRYFYSIMARDIVRGAESQWVFKNYGFALKPDIVLYLKADLDTLVARIVNGRGFDYWESGMDVGFGRDLYESFCNYQTRLMRVFDELSERFGFVTIDADRPVREIFKDLQQQIRPLLEHRPAALLTRNVGS